MMQSTKEVLRNFVGTWMIKRVLGNYGRAEGVAKFTIPQQSDSLLLQYREDVQVSYKDAQEGLSGTAHQEYIYLYDKDKDKIIKKFIDGRKFYEIKLDFDKMEGEGEHVCEQDFYSAKYQFQDVDHFTLAYCVKGPQKDYIIHTHFTRGEQDSASTSSFN